MAVGYVSKVSSSGLSTGSSVTLTGVTALPGETLILILDGYGALTGTVTDSSGNTWTARVTSVTNLINTIFHCQVKTALSSGTVTIALTGDNYYNATLSRWTGVGAYVSSNSGYLSGGSSNAGVAVNLNPGGVVTQNTGLLVEGVSSDAAFTNTTGATLSAGSISAGWIALDDNVNLKPPTYNFASAGTAYLITTNPALGSTTPIWQGPNGNARWGVAGATFVMGAFDLLMDGSFETDGNADGVADNWTETHTTVNNPAFSLSSSSPQVGTYSQRIQYTGQLLDGTPNKEIRLDQNTNPGSMVEGHRYMFNVWVKGSTTNSYVVIGINAHDVSNSFISGTSVSVINPTSTWTKYTVNYVAPANSSYAKVYVKVDNINVLSTVDVYFDGAEFLLDDVTPYDTDPTYVTGRTLPASDAVSVQSRTPTFMINKFDNTRVFNPQDPANLNVRSWGTGNTEVAWVARTGSTVQTMTSFARAVGSVVYDQLAPMTRTVETQPNTLTFDTYEVDTIPNTVPVNATNVITGTTTGVYVTLDYQWNMTGALVLSKSYNWNVVGALVLSKDYNWNVYQIVSTSPKDYQWNVLLGNAPVDAAPLDCQWNVYGTVGPNITGYQWNLSAVVNTAATDYQWNLRAVVSPGATDYQWNDYQIASTTATDYNWNLLARVSTSATDYNWNVIAQVTLSPDYNWNIYQIATAGSMDTEWNLYAAVSPGATDYNWNTFGTADSSLDTQWFTLVDAAEVGLAYAWNISEVVNGSLDTQWNVVGLLGMSLDYNWNVRNIINSGDLDTDWNILEIAGSDATDVNWNVLSAVNKSQQAAWSVWAALSAPKSYNWNILTSMDDDALETSWNVSQALSSAKDYGWNYYDVINKSAGLAWSVYGSADKLRNTQWDTLEIYDLTQDFLWHVLASLSTSGTDYQWHVLGLVSDSQGYGWHVLLMPFPRVENGTVDILPRTGFVLILRGNRTVTLLAPVASPEILTEGGTVEILSNSSIDML